MADTPWCGNQADKLYLTSGQFESTLKTSQYIGGIDATPTGISYDGADTPWCGSGGPKLYLTSGQFTSTLKNSFDISGIDAYPWGISYDGTNTPWAGNEADKLYLASGQFESTLKTSEDVSGIDTWPIGISYDGTNTPWMGNEAHKLYLTSGQFESTLKTSEDVSGIEGTPTGVSWDGTNTPWCGSGAGAKLYLTSGQFTSTLKTSASVNGIDTSSWGISTNNWMQRLGAVTLSEQFSLTNSIDTDVLPQVPDADLSITTDISVDFYAGAQITLTEALDVTLSSEADILSLVPEADLAITTGFDGLPHDLVPSANFDLSVSITEPTITTLNFSNSNRIYIFTLTGAADGTTDIDIPISSFSSRLKNGEPSYLSVVIPGDDYLSYVNARLNGDLVVRIGYKDGDTIILTEIVAEVDFDNIQYSEGATNKSITLDGYRTETFLTKTVTLQGASYKNLDEGKLRYRCSPNLYLKPGDTAEYGDDSFIVDSISFSVSANSETYEVAE